ncbi:MAG: dynamin family protein [Proteobacteria bacterium]|nr:dynamin family protein [Pseudomonadota bacterium]
MNTYDALKQELIQAGEAFKALFEKAETFSGISGNFFQNWKNTLEIIQRQIAEDLVRVAVVGPIKSGKSTFVNALFRDDYLKRGAGVITSIVTRIRCGESLKASICFKSWDEVNRDIEQGLSLFPAWKPESEDFRFDIRKSIHRDMLEKILESLTADQLITNDTRNITSVLLSSYLSGFDRVKDIIGPDQVIKIHEHEDFHKHRNYTGDEILAVYIKDIQLEIHSDVLDRSIEIADCQGSDSPNPLHLAMIQDYLSVTHFIVYVVSSRTGLRQADIRFLTMIRDMGIMDNMLFVVNCDFSEHESFDDFSRLIAKIRSELALIIPNPDVFTLSALYNLFGARKKSQGETSLTRKDLVRLEQWEAELSFTELSNRETERFESFLHGKLTRERYFLLLGNHVERLSLVANGLAQWAGMNKDLLSRDSDSAGEIIRNIKKNQEKTTKVSNMIRSTLDGAVKTVSGNVKGVVDTFFDERNGDIISGITSFISRYDPSYESYFENGAIPGLNHNLFMVYQDFKNALDNYITESITPKIVGFVRRQDETILEDLDQMTRPYSSMVEDALMEYGQAMAQFGIGIEMPARERVSTIPDLETLKSMVNLKYQPASKMMNYSTMVRVEALVRFGFYNLISFVKKVFKKKAIDKKSDQIQALKDGLDRMKKETMENVLSHFKSYRENIKFQYFYKLTDAVANAFYDLHTAHFHAYVTDLDTLATLIREKKLDKDTVMAELSAMETRMSDLKEKIKRIREKITLI